MSKFAFYKGNFFIVKYMNPIILFHKLNWMKVLYGIQFLSPEAYCCLKTGGSKIFLNFVSVLNILNKKRLGLSLKKFGMKDLSTFYTVYKHLKKEDHKLILYLIGVFLKSFINIFKILQKPLRAKKCFWVIV